MEQNNILVSIIMSVYNDEKYLNEALDSIFAQTIQNFELIIIDDCSTDDTVKIIESYHDKRIRLMVNDKNEGLTKNLNKALKYVRGKYIARMDGDDRSRPQRFEKQIAFLEENPDLMLISCRTHMFGEEDLISDIQGTPKQLQTMMLIRPVLAHPGFMMRRELIEVHGFQYDETYRSAQDYNFAVRVAREFSIGITKEILLDYRVHKKQVSSKFSGEQMNNASRVRNMQLDWLGIQLNSEQRDVLEKWSREVKNVSPDEYKEAYRLINIFIQGNLKTYIYSEKELKEELIKLLIQWIIRGKSVTSLKTLGWILGLSCKNLNLLCIKIYEMLKY